MALLLRIPEVLGSNLTEIPFALMIVLVYVNMPGYWCWQ
jgi:hypothetical protein